MLEHVKAVISSELQATMQLFSVGQDLAFSTNRVKKVRHTQCALIVSHASTKTGSRLLQTKIE